MVVAVMDDVGVLAAAIVMAIRACRKKRQWGGILGCMGRKTNIGVHGEEDEG